ncbi:hypothetical protein RI129_006208 [Pyrocoelia pectoralis]|uniref:Uncharacterized protein n=1 Tax=Pyrocoelia pectoralis TaxID=417401 RepID=A0AAN7VDQ5_9COLE
MSPQYVKGEKKRTARNLSPQKVIIPKGMINPKETTIIEIPARLHRQPIVIAKHKNSEIGCGLLCSSFKSENESMSSKNSADKPVPNNLNVSSERSNETEDKSHQGPSMKGAPKLSKEKNYNQKIPVSGSSKNLDIMEEKERTELQRDLEVFQRARRNLLKILRR